MYQQKKPLQFFFIFIQSPAYHSFDDYLEQEFGKFKEFISDGGLEKLENSNNTFYESVLAGTWGRLLKGIYVYHLQRWLKIFPKKDILVVDGDLLTSKPWVIMQEIQEFLNVPKLITEKHFVVNKATGFFCIMTPKHGRMCLGDNKGKTRTVSEDGSISSKISF